MLLFPAIHSPDEVPTSYSDAFLKSIPNTKDGIGKHRRTVAGMVACLDEAVGNVTAALTSAGMMDDTVRFRRGGAEMERIRGRGREGGTGRGMERGGEGEIETGRTEGVG